MTDVKEGKVPVTEKNVNFLFYFFSCLLHQHDHSKSLQHHIVSLLFDFSSQFLFSSVL